MKTKLPFAKNKNYFGAFGSAGYISFMEKIHLTLNMAECLTVGLVPYKAVCTGIVSSPFTSTQILQTKKCPICQPHMLCNSVSNFRQCSVVLLELVQ